jgi:hypothetical protein
VGKTIPEVQKAYLAGFIDGDGAIMALLERHPAKRFGFRVRVWVKATDSSICAYQKRRKSTSLYKFWSAELTPLTFPVGAASGTQAESLS